MVPLAACPPVRGLVVWICVKGWWREEEVRVFPESGVCSGTDSPALAGEPPVAPE